MNEFIELRLVLVLLIVPSFIRNMRAATKKDYALGPTRRLFLE